MKRVDVSKLKGVPETLLIPLMGRALESQKDDGILNDPKSLEIFKRLDYNFDKFLDEHSRRSYLRTTIRTAIIDRILKDFLVDQPDTTVVEIGCGLNTRFERISHPRVRWFDLDLPEVYEVWSVFFTETDRRHFLPGSAFDGAWMEQLQRRSSGPYFFISEASVIYFPENQVLSLFSDLQRHFPRSHYLFDSGTPAFVQSLEDTKDALKYCTARFQWTLDDVYSLEHRLPDLEVRKTVELEQPDREFSDLYPPGFEPVTDGYQLNLVRL